MPEPRRDQQFALECEQHLLSSVGAGEGIPVEAYTCYCGNVDDGVPSGIGRHPDHGWFVLVTCGQGPMFDWTEW